MNVGGVNTGSCSNSDKCLCKVNLAVSQATPAPAPGGCDATACVNVDVVTTTKNWGEEVSWNIPGVAACATSTGSFSRYADSTKSCCLPPGTHTINCLDSYGDGWHGGYLTIGTTTNICKTFSYGSSATGSITIGQCSHDRRMHIDSALCQLLKYALKMTQEAQVPARILALRPAQPPPPMRLTVQRHTMGIPCHLQLDGAPAPTCPPG